MPDAPYPYSAEMAIPLVNCLSPERFQTYLDAVGDEDQVAGLRRYIWNANVAARFHGPLHLLEVSLRNAVHQQMANRYGGWWFEGNKVGHQETQAVADAKTYLSAKGDAITPGKVVAEVGFRFWVGLFASRHHSIWKTDLAKLFTPRVDRSTLHDDLDRLRTLRNRIAHHEPIFRRNLMDDALRIDRIVTAISPDMADWLNWHNRIADAVALPEVDVGSF